MKALDISHLFKKNPLKLQENFTSIFNNKKVKVKKLKILKEKLIIANQYKITSLAFLENNFPSWVILEIHDNQDYFKRSLFALKNLNTKEVKVPKLFGVNEKLKIIYREYLEGDFLYFLYNFILKKKIDIEGVHSFVKKAATYLSFLHNFKFKKIPKFLSKKINGKMEKIILKRTLEFIKPNIESLRPIFERNLKILFQRIYHLEKINKSCLIHGDYQPANFVLSSRKRLRLMDFDTLEIGNPARDLGRFLAQITYFLKFKLNRFPLKEINNLESLFLKNYFNSFGPRKINFYPDFETNINTYKAQMFQCIILSKIWGDQRRPSKEVEEILDYQSSLLNL